MIRQGLWKLAGFKENSSTYSVAPILLVVFCEGSAFFLSLPAALVIRLYRLSTEAAVTGLSGVKRVVMKVARRY